jgi:hypothetical protein
MTQQNLEQKVAKVTKTFEQKVTAGVAVAKANGTTANGRESTRINSLLFAFIGVHSRFENPCGKNKILIYSSTKEAKVLLKAGIEY